MKRELARICLLGAWVFLAMVLVCPVARCDFQRELDEALWKARSTRSLLVLSFVRGSDPSSRGASTALESAEWLSRLAPHSQLLVNSSDNQSVASRFGVDRFPSFIVLDGEGRVEARLVGQFAADSTARSLRELLDSAERFQDSQATLASDPNNVEALYWVGAHRWNRGERVEATSCLEKVAALGVQATRSDGMLASNALRMLGESALDEGRFKEAEDLFRRALERNGSEEFLSRSALGLSRSLRRQGRIPEAIQTIESRFATESSQPYLDQALFALGYLYLELGEREKAALPLRGLVERFPKSAYAERALRYGLQVTTGSLGNLGLSTASSSSKQEREVIVWPSHAPESQALTTVSLTGSNMSVEELR